MRRRIRRKNNWPAKVSETLTPSDVQFKLLTDWVYWSARWKPEVWTLSWTPSSWTETNTLIHIWHNMRRQQAACLTAGVVIATWLSVVLLQHGRGHDGSYQRGWNAVTMHVCKRVLFTLQVCTLLQHNTHVHAQKNPGLSYLCFWLWLFLFSFFSNVNHDRRCPVHRVILPNVPASDILRL